MSAGRIRSFLAARLLNVYGDYPRQFWVLMGAAFIDMVGNTLLLTFFALFLTDKFDISMARAGIVFAIFAATNFVGGTLGGALVDSLGRKPVVLFGLVASALGNLAVVLAGSFTLVCGFAAILGIADSIATPAWQSMKADILPPEKRSEGFGLSRVMFNLALVVGPALGGLLAGVSFVLVFAVDAVASVITAVLLFIFIPETKPDRSEDAPQQKPDSLLRTFRGYGQVLSDRTFFVFVLIATAVSLVYFQMNTTLSVYLRDEHGIALEKFGLLISLNAVLIVFLQLPVTRKIRQRGLPSMLVLSVGTLLYALGFSMFGYTQTYALFALAMVVITAGEILSVPVGQAIAARLAPDHMRGRYLAVYSLNLMIASGLGPWLAGQVINTLGFEWVWYIAGFIGVGAALAYFAMHLMVDVPETAPRPVERAPERVAETGR
ncbi:MAG TPA: MFS transporter [Aggregatilinea sp.]|uniref:MDR family MFS transporter n=1 Tax=Aggregatilinea sp. TaxID=2806333 RepID=UPI002CEA6502|nr:MFS transporter [Aggregatilinea sp.]HML21756.1 MFS transporter [Aggregatilinea sp.]